MEKMIFDTHGGDSNLNDRTGQTVEVISTLTAREADIDDVGTMYRVRFDDGFETDVFADELTPYEETDAEFYGKILWNELLAHRGHNIRIVSYGDPDDPVDVCLECEDCGEVILDAGIYTLCAREDK